MTRFRPLLVALGLAGAATASAVVACKHPGEAPPLAPKPEKGQPAAPPIAVPAVATDGGELRPGPVTVTAIPTPILAAGQETEVPDAGLDDAYVPNLPPIPDSNIPADSRVEPEQR